VGAGAAPTASKAVAAVAAAEAEAAAEAAAEAPPLPARSTDIGTSAAAEVTRESLEAMVVPELKAILKSQGSKVSGRKTELVDRILEGASGDLGGVLK